MQALFNALLDLPPDKLRGALEGLLALAQDGLSLQEALDYLKTID